MAARIKGRFGMENLEMVMEKAVYSLDDKIDYYLHKISIAPTLTLDARVLYEVDVLNEETYLVDQVMLEKGIIKEVKGTRVITGKGLEISNFGGWTLYQKLLRKESQQSFFTNDSTYKKYEKEVKVLKRRITELESEISSREQKENVSSLIIKNLIVQNKNNKVTAFVTGAIAGAVASVALWILFAK